MRPQTSQLDTATNVPRAQPRPNAAEIVQRWHEDGGVEGATLEWILDRMRPLQEART